MVSSQRIALIASYLSRPRRTAVPGATMLLVMTTLLAGRLAAQDQPPKPPEDVFSVATQDALTKTIAERERQSWTAFKKNDASAFAALTTEDYRAVWANGALHFYRPTAQEMAAINVTQYVISQFHAVPIGHDGALVTYVGQVVFQGNYAKVAYSEVWVKPEEGWKCEYSQATVTP